MNLIKWIRKNERKLMAIFVVVLMIAFVGGYALTQILRGMGPGTTVIATYNDGEEITNNDVAAAQSELKILQSMMVAEFMYRWPQQAGGTNAQLLAQVLFPNSELAVQLETQFEQSAITTPAIDESDVAKFFNQAGQSSAVNWIILKEEARRAGCVVTAEDAAKTYDVLVASMSQGQASGTMLLNRVVEQTRQTKDRLLQVFADLRSIMLYADLTTNTQNVTLAQIKSGIGYQNELISAEYVEFPADDYIDQAAEPTEQELQTQFDAFKQYRQGQFAPANPYGFGYKLPDRVQLGYIYLELDDVENVIEKPTEDELTEYYQANTHEFTFQEPVDENDPEGEKVQKLRDFADVRNQIRNILVRQRKNSRANLIINEALDMADAALVDVDLDEASAQTLQQNAPSYEQIAQRLTEKHGVRVYAGKTGYLSPVDLTGDRVLGSLRMEGAGPMGTDLASMVFSVQPLQDEQAEMADAQAAKMWMNLGPLQSYQGRAIVRAIDAKPEQVPDSIDVSYPFDGARPGEAGTQDIFSVKEQVTEDVKMLKALDSAKQQAQALAKKVKDEGWENVLQAEGDDQVKTTKFEEKRRLSLMREYSLDAAIEAMPSQAQMIRRMAQESRQAAYLYNLAGSMETDAELLEFKPGHAWYVVKSVSVQPATTQDLTEQLGRQASAFNQMSAQSVMILHYTPENIHQRTNFAFERDEEEQTEQEDQQQQ